jgi:hypothetical protein
VSGSIEARIDLSSRWSSSEDGKASIIVGGPAAGSTGTSLRVTSSFSKNSEAAILSCKACLAAEGGKNV